MLKRVNFTELSNKKNAYRADKLIHQALTSDIVHPLSATANTFSIPGGISDSLFRPSPFVRMIKNYQITRTWVCGKPLGADSIFPAASKK